MNPVAQRIANLLATQVGVIEKPKNLVTYSAELDAVEQPRIPRQGSPWCGTLMDWGFWKCDALAALPLRSFSTVAAARAYMIRGQWSTDPAAGDLAFLHDSGPHGHVGFVISVPGNGKVVTIEGNTSLTGSQTKGGMVATRTRPVSWWAGFGRPNYGAVSAARAPDLAVIGALVAAARTSTLQEGSKGPAVTVLQNALHITADGDFGPETKRNVIAFQKWYSGIQIAQGLPETINGEPNPFLLAVTGTVDPHTWAALLGEVAN